MFTQIKSKKVYQHVIEQIQNMIMDGTLKRGDKLPSERHLAELLGVSRTSIREALRALEIIGLIESRQGEGTFIKGSVDTSLFEPLSVMFMLSDGKPHHILELRKIIEIESAKLASEKISEKDKKELQKIMNNLRNSENEKESSKFDKKFHYKIAECTGNYLILNLLNAISSLITSFIKGARWEILVQNKSEDFLINQHQEICDAIVTNDSEKAELAMKEHLEYINNVIEKL